MTVSAEPFRTIAVSSTGDMGHAIGTALRESGFDVVACLDGRSDLSRQRATRAGIRTLPDLDAVVGECDLFLSILPPALAHSYATDVAAAMSRAQRRPLFADLNAIAPATAVEVEATIVGAGGEMVDGGIVGPPPGRGQPPRLFVSGARANELSVLSGPQIDVRPCGTEVGRASAIKMCYAAMTKGTNALATAVLIAADRLGVYGEIAAEFADSQPELYARMEASVPILAADAWRFAGEMDEIAETFAAAGVTPNFHRGAGDLYRHLAATPLAAETKETIDRSRTLAETIAIVAEPQ
jgi:3-hydroxyisobutyrate dehydrogenase-like beta-hydroxyacid dehydrogenase